MNEAVRQHYEKHPYPEYPLLASVRRCDTYALNLECLWARFNGSLPPPTNNRILLAGCGTFSPYPASLANPNAVITALDLSATTISKAKLHAVLHGCFNIKWLQGDLLDPGVAPGPFDFIDSYGVIHHLSDPLEGLKALEQRLVPGGILRLMVYSRQGRRGAESIRKAFRILGIRDLDAAKKLMNKSRDGSRFNSYLADFYEATFDSGIADAFLHPQARTFSIDELMTMIGRSSLQPLLFAHNGALPDLESEVARLRQCEHEGSGEGNHVLYLGKDVVGTCSLDNQCKLMLNPALRNHVTPLNLLPVTVSPKLGFVNPHLNRESRRFLRQFSSPVPLTDLSASDRNRLEIFLHALFLVCYH